MAMRKPSGTPRDQPSGTTHQPSGPWRPGSSNDGFGKGEDGSQWHGGKGNGKDGFHGTPSGPSWAGSSTDDPWQNWKGCKGGGKGGGGGGMPSWHDDDWSVLGALAMCIAVGLRACAYVRMCALRRVA